MEAEIVIIHYYYSFIIEIFISLPVLSSLLPSHPRSTWGESLFIALQVVVILGLMFHYNSHMLFLAVFVPAYASLAWYLTSDLASMAVLSALQASVTPVLIASRVRVVSRDARSLVCKCTQLQYLSIGVSFPLPRLQYEKPCHSVRWVYGVGNALPKRLLSDCCDFYSSSVN